MLSSSDCKFCGDSLHIFIEELEDGIKLNMLLCPTCYGIYQYSRVPSKQVAVSQQVDSIMSIINRFRL